MDEWIRRLEKDAKEFYDPILRAIPEKMPEDVKSFFLKKSKFLTPLLPPEQWEEIRPLFTSSAMIEPWSKLCGYGKNLEPFLDDLLFAPEIWSQIQSGSITINPYDQIQDDIKSLKNLVNRRLSNWDIAIDNIDVIFEELNDKKDELAQTWGKADDANSPYYYAFKLMVARPYKIKSPNAKYIFYTKKLSALMRIHFSKANDSFVSACVGVLSDENYFANVSDNTNDIVKWHKAMLSLQK